MTPLPLRDQARGFASELVETLTDVLPSAGVGLELTAAQFGQDEQSYELTTSDPKGIELTVDGKPAFRFEMSYRLTANSRGDWLKVQSSVFSFVPDG